jgi:hypothetical protein
MPARDSQDFSIVSVEALPIDIDMNPMSIGLSGDNEMSNEVPLGFSFPYGASTVSAFRVTTNGVMTFDAQDPGANNVSPAEQPLSGAFLAPFWDDLEVVPGVGDIIFGLGGESPHAWLRWRWEM